MVVSCCRDGVVAPSCGRYRVVVMAVSFGDGEVATGYSRVVTRASCRFGGEIVLPCVRRHVNMRA